jgi:hypothetical protein
MSELHEPIPDCVGCRFPKDGARHERFPYEESYREGYTAGWFLGRVVFIVLLPIVWPIAAAARFNQRLAKLLLAVLAIAVTYLSLDVLDRFFLDPLKGGEQAGFAFVFEAEALAIDADDNRVVQDPNEHRHGEYAGAGEGSIPAAEGEIRS